MLPTSFLPLRTTKPWFPCFAGIGSGNTADMVRSDLLGCVQNPATVEAVLALQAAWDAIGATNQTTVLQAAYITDNPNPVGSKDELSRAPGALQYHAVHERYHDMFRMLVRSKGYYDLFLFNLRGDCVYTVFKEVDFASNLVGGRYNSSGLGTAFRAAVAEPSAVHVADFAPYEPSHGALASFICTGVDDVEGTLVGIICIQQPSDLAHCSSSPKTRAALFELCSSWDDMQRSGLNTTTVLQAAYITDNPNPVGSKDELNRAPGALQYHAVHERYHDMFRTLVRSKGYYDLFLFNLRGDCVYTVFKEVDFASNFVSGRWWSSGLGDAFRAAVAVPSALHTIDFAPYEPSQGDLASFVSTGVMTDDGVVIGVIALQVPFGVTVKLDSTGARIESCADARRSCFAA